MYSGPSPGLRDLLHSFLSSLRGHPVLPWEGHRTISWDSRPSSFLPKGSVAFVSSLQKSTEDLIFCSRHEHDGTSNGTAYRSTSVPPSFTHPPSSSPFFPGKCLFTSQSPKTNTATFSIKTSSAPKAKVFALSLLPFYTHLFSSTLHLQK